MFSDLLTQSAVTLLPTEKQLIYPPQPHNSQSWPPSSLPGRPHFGVIFGPDVWQERPWKLELAATSQDLPEMCGCGRVTWSLALPTLSSRPL